MQNLRNTPSAVLSTAALYDLSLLQELDGDEYLLEMLEVLLQEVPKDIKEMKDAAVAGRGDIICTKAHKLKSTAAIIQAEQLTQLLGDIEAFGKTESPGNELTQMIDTAVDLCSQIESGLKMDAARLMH
ncbi:MAG: hypothetical protein JWR61_4072 [Ferruginibacter sp.]|uniref:Hpt domain-containing protein n=1 Tax=Ferruginibacter sp. TaxID=1940288 RepID=UPI002658B391|nr:Hpt domain-containing protein [Ferruginibacter sp.]MDB5279117.1 hypothetical protein [Ferruginibacter sp.]